MEKEKSQIQTQFKLDEFFGMRKGKMSYPSVCIIEEFKEDNVELPIVDSILSPGELSLWIIYKGKLLEIKKISKDVKTLHQLIQFYSIEVFISDSVSYRVKTIDDLIEIDEFDWS